MITVVYEAKSLESRGARHVEQLVNFFPNLVIYGANLRSNIPRLAYIGKLPGKRRKDANSILFLTDIFNAYKRFVESESIRIRTSIFHRVSVNY